MQSPTGKRHSKLVTALIETFGFSPLIATIVAAFLFVLAGSAALWVILSAPPRTITILTGPDDSSFQRTADQHYRGPLAKRGVTLKVVTTGGSLDNLDRLSRGEKGVDVAFVQGGLMGDKPPPPNIVSLGSISYQPLFIFYRSEKPIELLSELAGKRIGIGAKGSGVHALAMALLEANNITAAPTILTEDDSEDGSKALLQGKLDAIFLMGDSAPIAILRTLIRDPAVKLYSFVQADAYVRRLTYLNRIVLPRGSIDFAKDLPARDVILVGPTVELLARKGFHSALSDVLLDAVRDWHHRPSLLAKRDEFPAPLEREYPISDDAKRFYKSGKLLTYDIINSFWLASLINRALVAIVPFFLVLIPAIRFLPVMYRWTVQLRIYRCYRPLLRLERNTETPLTSGQAEELMQQLDGIERDVERMKVPASFASQFYDLRNHVVFVRNRIRSAAARA